ncbi:hypothetical protein C0V97_12250 [Asaia sp. W19]|uniref:AsmA family protein n=1 Tax=unclassified Asaia TaxID=2685023 RepID=UPI000F8EE0F8|nr:AsmA family protein [Asaia sp. W19]RUT25349.1 hypothetical protein C0V97_12250 [Asaia sp. W19]
MKRLTAALIVILVLATVLAVSAHILVDRSNLKQDVITAVKRQTGRDLTMARFSVGILPWPSISAHQVTLSDLPTAQGGGTSQPMIEARDIRASVALMPLLWREIRLENLTMLRGAVRLHRNEAGLANWDFKPEPAPASAGSAGTSHPSAHWGVKLGSARLDQMAFSLDDRYAHHGGAIVVDHAEFDGLASSAPYLDLHGRRGDTPFRINGHVGPLTLLQGANPPWALSLGATLGKDGKQQDWLNFDGQITDTRHLRGFSGVLRGEMASLKDAESLFPNANLPDLQGIGGEIGLYDADPQKPDAGKADSGPAFSLSRLGVNHLHIHLGAAPPWQGVSVSALHADADTLSSALTVSATLQGAASGLALQGSFGTLAQAGTAWQTGLQTPLTVSADLRDSTALAASSGLKAHVTGQVGAPETQLALQGEARSLTIHQATLHDLSLKGGLTRDREGTLKIDALAFQSHEMTGELTLAASAPLLTALQGSLHFAHLDLDSLGALWKPAEVTSNKTATGAGTDSASPGRPSATQSSTAAPAQSTVLPLPILGAGQGTSGAAAQVSGPSGSGKLPGLSGFDWRAFLHGGSGNLAISAETLRFNQADYTGISATLLLGEGHLTIQSIHGSGNGMTLSGEARYDMAVTPARLSLTLSPLLFPATLAQNLLGLPDLFRGPLMLVGQLQAEGETKAALMTSLDGHLGLSMVGGSIAASHLGPYLGDAARSLMTHGDLGVRCLGLHAAFASGRAQLDTIGMEAGALSLSGQGSYGLADGTLDLHLLPRIGFGGTGASTPVVVTGTLDSPKAHQEASAGGRFEITIGGSQPDHCPDLLTKARENVAGEPAAEPKKHSQASELLHGLGILH